MVMRTEGVTEKEGAGEVDEGRIMGKALTTKGMEWIGLTLSLLLVDMEGRMKTKRDVDHMPICMGSLIMV